ncbi:hypothetical protein C479_10520 [Halovivax asiaticus JCM 14624]|uniref:PGF-CTERM sorting domain-containing protein n=1 Tax=Halovivax asiaticus JCM 14624 TaxID=1227490 RepID=M0BG19_9EURY|nr:hypothetical protein [Halovivax asiaticus]ELZ09248.1 hypothetical protein C479_10520 [Halovivax asiaticus JCM 14624]
MHPNSRIRTIALVVIVTMVAVSTLSAAPIAASDDPPPPPHSFHGEVYVDGEPASPGTEIVAMIDGEERGEIVVSENGTYGGPTVGDEKLVVHGENGDENKTITFLVDGEAANENAAWTASGDDEFHLVVGDAPGGGGGGGFGAPPSDSDGDDGGSAQATSEETDDNDENAGDGADDGDSDGDEATGEDGDDGSGSPADDDASSMPGFGSASAFLGLLASLALLDRRQ